MTRDSSALSAPVAPNSAHTTFPRSSTDTPQRALRASTSRMPRPVILLVLAFGRTGVLGTGVADTDAHAGRRHHSPRPLPGRSRADARWPAAQQRPASHRRGPSPAPRASNWSRTKRRPALTASGPSSSCQVAALTESAHRSDNPFHRDSTRRCWTGPIADEQYPRRVLRRRPERERSAPRLEQDVTEVGQGRLALARLLDGLRLPAASRTRAGTASHCWPYRSQPGSAWPPGR